jgi:hypothetical protein
MKIAGWSISSIPCHRIGSSNAWLEQVEAMGDREVDLVLLEAQGLTAAGSMSAQPLALPRPCGEAGLSAVAA